MQHCLICGAASWGPAKSGSLVVSGDFQLELTEAEVSEWRRCDSCGGLAQAVFIDKAPPAEPDANFDSPLDGIMKVIGAIPRGPDPLSEAMKMMAGFAERMSDPETRLERLVKAIIRQQGRDGSSQSTEVWAHWLVSAGRAIEREMDKPQPHFINGLIDDSGAVPDGPWLALNWPDRDSFVAWMSLMLDKTRPGFGQGWDSIGWAEAIANQFSGKTRDPNRGAT